MPTRESLWMAALLAAFGWGCVTAPSSNSSPPTARYDYERHPLHLELSAFHRTDDTTDLLISLPSRDLLYAKDNADAAFEAKLDLLIRTNTQEGSTDTLLLQPRISYREDMPMRVHVAVPIAVAAGAEDHVSVKLTDVRRDRSASVSLRLDKRGTTNHQNYRIDLADGTPLTGGTAPQGATVSVWCPRCEGDQLQLLQRTDPAKLPPPPFSYNGYTPRSFGPNHMLLDPYFPEDKRMEFDLLEGTYLFTHSDALDQGRVVVTTSGLYPEVTTAAGMAETLRYVTSRAEYEELNGSNQRQQVEAFWMKCAEDREKARELIRIYYGRVREANAYFTEAVPGWKTDRGLIHIVFGNPQKMHVSSTGETWIYGEEDNLNALVFRFNKAASGHTENRYLLERNEQLVKVRWERAITSWRNGRIYAE